MRIKRQNELLELKVLERTRQLQASRIEIIWRLATPLSLRMSRPAATSMAALRFRRLVGEAFGQSRQSWKHCSLRPRYTIWAKLAFPMQFSTNRAS